VQPRRVETRRGARRNEYNLDRLHYGSIALRVSAQLISLTQGRSKSSSNPYKKPTFSPSRKSRITCSSHFSSPTTLTTSNVITMLGNPDPRRTRFVYSFDIKASLGTLIAIPLAIARAKAGTCTQNSNSYPNSLSRAGVTLVLLSEEVLASQLVRPSGGKCFRSDEEYF